MSVPTVTPLPANLDKMLRRDLAVLAQERGIFVTPTHTGAYLRELLRRDEQRRETAARYAPIEAANAASRERRRAAHEAANAALVDTRLPRRAMADAAGVFARLNSPFANGADEREVRLRHALAQLVNVARAAADPASGVTLDDLVREARDAEGCMQREEEAARRQADEVANTLRAIAQSLAMDGR
jgi:hypothetical protein